MHFIYLLYKHGDSSILLLIAFNLKFKNTANWHSNLGQPSHTRLVSHFLFLPVESFRTRYTWALKSGKYAIGTHLQIIFNDCIQEKVFPTILKDAQVFERFFLNQLVEYLEKFAHLNKKQFGFQSRKSSTDAVLYFIEKIIGNMEDNDTGALFLDLAKAFNSISHEIFLKKTENFNLSQSTILLLNSFLKNRTQCVKLGIDL